MPRMIGSLANRMQEGAQLGEPYVGMGATEMLYSDRRPYTVQRVLGPRRVDVTRDRWTRVDHNGRSEDQEYAYESTPLVEGEPSWRCTHPFGHLMEGNGGDAPCWVREPGGECEGCRYWRRTRETNGIELRLCKRGWKRVGSDTYFTLGIREAYEDPCF